MQPQIRYAPTTSQTKRLSEPAHVPQGKPSAEAAWPANGRADDQVRRNHSAQYISHPDWPWFRLRKETPERYESYVDLVAGEWTKVKIEVHGAHARLFVHDQPQPTLIVNNVKTGPTGKGAIALWLDVGTEAHFRNLTVTRESSRLP